MIGYFYSGTYAENLDEDDTDEDATLLSRLTLHLEMYRLADKYDVSGLMELALANFKKHFSPHYPARLTACRASVLSMS